MLTHPVRAVAVALSLLLLPMTPLGDRRAMADDESHVSFRLRHSFSLVPGLPGHGKREPTSCFDSEDNKRYLCRIVAGVEEAGDKQDFVVLEQDVLERSDHAEFGRVLIGRDDEFYEGCGDLHRAPIPYAPGKRAYTCDYQTRRYVSREHYTSKGWVLNVFWRWIRYTGDQASCALALSSVWARFTGKTFVLLINDCKNGPLSSE